MQRRGCGKRSQKAGAERGQGMLEFVVTLPLWLLLATMVWSFALYWWMQVSAATAVHDGVGVVAQGGAVHQGRGRAAQVLDAALGPMGEGLKRALWVRHLPAHRSVVGGLSASWQSPLRYWGFPDMHISARSFQRDERFYGGAPDVWE